MLTLPTYMGRDYGSGAAGGGASLESFSIGSAQSSNEGNSGTTTHTWTINRSGDTSRAASVDWAVTGTGANPANASDFVGGVLPSGTVNFSVGESSKTFAVQVQGDTTVETTETYLVTLSNARVTAAIVAATAVGTVTNDDSSGLDWTGVAAPIDTTRWAQTFYQDVAGTTLVTASGQDVACIRHPVGTPGPIVWQAPNTTNCWRLNIIGGVPFLEPKFLTADAQNSILDYTFGSASARVQFGMRLRSGAVITNDARILSPRDGGASFYVSKKTGGEIEWWNGGGNVFRTGAAFTAGNGGTIDAILASGGDIVAGINDAPEEWGRFRLNGVARQLGTANNEGQATAASPGQTQMNGIRLGGVSAGFGGYAADVKIRALYFHQASATSGLLTKARVDEINAFLAGLAL